MHSSTREFHAKFLDSLTEVADAGQVADAAVAIWREIDAALAPIIGQPGMVALLRRCQHLVRAAHPWLGAFQPATPAAPAFDALHAALAAQPADAAAQGNAALLQAFHDLLASLIGPSLCERLLRPVFLPPSSGSAAQDPSR